MQKGQVRLSIEEYRLLIRDKKRGIRRNKYNAQKVVYGPYTFDSIWEFQVWRDHYMLQRAKKISHLKVHPIFPLFIEGKKVCDYEADIQFTDNVTGLTVVGDAKSYATMTKLSRLKHKMFRAQYKYELRLFFKPKGWNYKDGRVF